MCFHSSWVEEFVGNPNHGHVALIDLIKDLADHPISVARKNTKKYAVLTRDPVRRNKLLMRYYWSPNLEIPLQWLVVSQSSDSTSSE